MSPVEDLRSALNEPAAQLEQAAAEMEGGVEAIIQIARDSAALIDDMRALEGMVAEFHGDVRWQLNRIEAGSEHLKAAEQSVIGVSIDQKNPSAATLLDGIRILKSETATLDDRYTALVGLLMLFGTQGLVEDLKELQQNQPVLGSGIGKLRQSAQAYSAAAKVTRTAAWL